MTNKELKHIIEQGESETVEFKQSFNKTVIETLVAFSNTKGGKVLIGVTDNGKIEKYGSGIKPVFTICKNYGIIPPEINVSDNGFKVVLFKEKINVPLNERQKNIMESIEKINI